MGKFELFVILVDGKDLPAKDLFPRTSDPFVNFKVGSQVKTSSIKYKTLNPTWNEEFSFELEQLSDLVIEGKVSLAKIKFLTMIF